jgi:hypothetical protein
MARRGSYGLSKGGSVAAAASHSKTISINIIKNTRPIPRLDSATGKGLNTYFLSSSKT